MITSVKLMGVCVSDQDRALDFYTNKLGFEVRANEPMGPDMRWIEVAPPGSQSALALFTPPGLENRIGTFSQIVFKCDDIQATYQELVQRGVTFTEPPKDQPGGGGVMATFVDPDGNAFVLGS
jgi:predicted enzyme related to lactoylglutathione lyase